MKSTYKRILTLVLALCMLCGMTSAAALAEALPEITLKMYFPGEMPAHHDEVWANVEAMSKDVLNAKFDIVHVPWSDYTDKMQVLVASGETFGMFFDANWLSYPMMVKNGALAELDGLMDEYAPNLKAYLEKEGVMEWAQVNGKQMAIPAINPTTDRAYVTYREDLRAKYDLPTDLSTIEALENYLDVVTANEDILAINNIIGAVNGDNAMNVMRSKYSLDFDLGYDMTFDLTNDQIVIVPLERTEAYREASMIRRSWYEKGWIPSNAMNAQESVNAINEGKYAVTLRWAEDAYNPLVGPGEKGASRMYPEGTVTHGSSLSNLMLFSEKAANPERAMMFLEWMNASQENYDAVLYGIEGVTYVLQEVDGVQMVVYPEGENADNGYLDWMGRWAFWRAQWRRPGFELTMLQIDKTREDLDFANNIISPLAGFAIDTEPVKTELANRQAIMDEYGRLLQYGLQENVEGAIAELVEKMNAAGTDKVIEEFQRQVDAFLAAK